VKAESAGKQRTVPDTVGGDSLAAARQDSTKTDSTRGEKVDPAHAWKTWKDLSRAIALRPLDGPEDILEKVEIIEDRIDDLLEEQKELETAWEEWDDRRQSLELQLEVLDDLAEVQRGGDLQLQQRMHSLREDLGKATHRMRVFKGSLKDLEKELDRLSRLEKDYREKAEDLRRREEEDR